MALVWSLRSLSFRATRHSSLEIYMLAELCFRLGYIKLQCMLTRFCTLSWSSISVRRTGQVTAASHIVRPQLGWAVLLQRFTVPPPGLASNKIVVIYFEIWGIVLTDRYTTVHWVPVHAMNVLNKGMI